MNALKSCQQLKALEECIAAQRALVATLERRGAEAASERERLTQLLRDLDALLSRCDQSRPQAA
jgi:hypothetical protein